jgi:hypothetical protein
MGGTVAQQGEKAIADAPTLRISSKEPVSDYVRSDQPTQTEQIRLKPKAYARARQRLLSTPKARSPT